MKLFLSPCVSESEPRDAGKDQRSSGIIRLHTIKQIIDRVSFLLNIQALILIGQSFLIVKLLWGW